MQESSSKPFSRIFNKIQTLEKQQPLNILIFETADFHPNPTVGRPGGRPTLPPVDRAVDRVPNRELGHFSRSIGWSTELQLVHVVHVGRPGRSTELLILRAGRPGRSTGQPAPAVVGLFSAAVSLPLRRRLPRRSLDDPSTIHVNFLSNILSFQQSPSCGISHDDACKLQRSERGNPYSIVGTSSEGHSHSGGFRLPVD